MRAKYHAFGTNAYGMTPFYRCFDNLGEVLALVKSNHDDETVYSLHVVYGELLEFEPATVVETFRIKEVAE